MKKYFYVLSLLMLLSGVACNDEAPGKNEKDFLSAVIDSAEWVPEKIYTQRTVGENAPLTIIGEGEELSMKLILRGITGEGEYALNAARSAEITIGKTVYTSLDIQDAGSITITRFEEDIVEGEFSFDAQWLSASKRLHVREGKFSVFYY